MVLSNEEFEKQKDEAFKLLMDTSKTERQIEEKMKEFDPEVQAEVYDDVLLLGMSPVAGAQPVTPETTRA